MEEISERIQAAVETLVDDIDRTVSRPQEKAAYQCSYQCYSDPSVSRTSLQNCVQQCQTQVERIDHVVRAELGSFQERLQRCALRCQDRAQSSFSPDSLSLSSPTPGIAQQEIERQLASCVRTCAEEELTNLPQMAQRIKYQANR